MKPVANQAFFAAAIDLLPAFHALSSARCGFAEPHAAQHAVTTVCVDLAGLSFRGTGGLVRRAAMTLEAGSAAAERIILAFLVILDTGIGSARATVAEVRAALNVRFATGRRREF